MFCRSALQFLEIQGILPKILAFLSLSEPFLPPGVFFQEAKDFSNHNAGHCSAGTFFSSSPKKRRVGSEEAKDLPVRKGAQALFKHELSFLGFLLDGQRCKAFFPTYHRTLPPANFLASLAPPPNFFSPTTMRDTAPQELFFRPRQKKGG